MDPEVLAFVSSAEGSAALKAPQDDTAGRKAIAMMAKVNPESCSDMVAYAETECSVPMEGSSVVELGPGAGCSLKAILARRPASITAFELSPVFRDMLSQDEALSAASEVLTIVPDDAISMSGVPSASVDVVVAMNVVYFLDPLAAYLVEMLRVLKPGGWVVFGAKDGAAVGQAAQFVNTDNAKVVEAMAQAGFACSAVEPARLLGADGAPGPATWIPLRGQKPGG